MEEQYRISPRKEDGKWIAYSDRSPYFYFEADTISEASAKAENALKLWRKHRRRNKKLKLTNCNT